MRIFLSQVPKGIIGNPVKIRSGPAAVIPIPVDAGIKSLPVMRHCSTRMGRLAKRGEPEDLPVNYRD